MSVSPDPSPSPSSPHEKSAIWRGFSPLLGAPEGFTLRTTVPTNPAGVEVMLERWEAGTSEPPHHHPGDDMTVVVEGHMEIQYYRREAGELVPEGPVRVLKTGDTGYVAAGQIHDARYVSACKLVYVHDRAFGFEAA